MKKIRYRAQRLEDKKMVFGFYTEDYVGVPFIQGFKGAVNETYRIDYKTIGQFTGLKDQNGEEVYEGDILELNNCGLLIVCFYKGEFKLQKLAEYHKKRNLYASISYLEFSVLRGNIYENPNLLQ